MEQAVLGADKLGWEQARATKGPREDEVGRGQGRMGGCIMVTTATHLKMGGLMAKKNWADLSTGQRIAVIIMGTIQMGLLVAALWDLAHRTPEEIRGDRRMWAGIVFINWFGPLAYFTIGRRDSPLLGKFRCESEDLSDLSGIDEEPAAI